MKNSVDLKLDMRTYGDPSNPCVISIVGTGASMNSMNPIVAWHSGMASPIQNDLYILGSS